jgi:glycosyltransferase involved in cell wall biosynthesis
MRIAYWTTSCLEPEIEAVSKEVFQLAEHFAGTFLFGISPHYVVRASWERRYLGFHPKFDLLLRLLIPALEQTCDVSHVYGEATPWIYYKSLHSKPIILTIASEKGLPRRDFIDRCQKVIVQTHSYYKKLCDLGIDPGKIELLYPGVDLTKFRPRMRNRTPNDRPKILFASSPRSAAEMSSRGVYLLLETARRYDSALFHLLYRAWRGGYSSLAETEKWLAANNVETVTLTSSVVENIYETYLEYDFTVIPFTVPDGGKECPLSAVEGLACGLPVLISSATPFAEFVAKHRCGVVFDPNPSGLIRAIELAQEKYAELSNNAVEAAQQFFSQARFLRRMDEIYRDALAA